MAVIQLGNETIVQVCNKAYFVDAVENCFKEQALFFSCQKLSLMATVLFIGSALVLLTDIFIWYKRNKRSRITQEGEKNK